MLGVSDMTVASVRKELESISQIRKCPRKTSDGRTYPAEQKPARKPASTAYVDDTPEGQKEAVSAGNKVRREKKEAAKEQRDKDNAELAALCSATTAEYQLFNEPCIHALNGDAGSIDWVITDPPYPKEYLHLYTVLSEVAAQVSCEPCRLCRLSYPT
jgi:hypothetical protein